MGRKEDLNPSPILFEVSSEVTIPGGEFIDPVYKHLGHEGYPVLFSAERSRILSEHGITLKKLESDYQIRAFVRKLNVDYKTPVKEGDRVTLITSATQPRDIEIIFHHEMRTGKTLDASSDCSYIVLDLLNKPISVPPELLEELNNIRNGTRKVELIASSLHYVEQDWNFG